VLVTSIGFIGERLWRLDWSTLQAQASWPLAAGLVGACASFAAANHALARAWAATTDPMAAVQRQDLVRVYARGVLMKYLPGSIFQYVSRHVGGRKAGLAHGQLVRSTVTEVGLHVVGSLTVAALCLFADRALYTAGAGAMILVAGGLLIHRPLLTALALQIAAFGLFAVAAALVGAAILPAGVGLGHFAALFMLAWLAGFVIPVAPGGLGVREAALLALSGSALPAAGLLAATLALRAASIAGDLVYGFGVLALARLQAVAKHLRTA
jgi:glycosyltransferase 2 family protein